MARNGGTGVTKEQIKEYRAYMPPIEGRHDTEDCRDLILKYNYRLQRTLDALENEITRADELEKILKDDDAKILVQVSVNEVIKEQAEKIAALERAIKYPNLRHWGAQNTPCGACFNYSAERGHDKSVCGEYCGTDERKNWQFDEARFTAQGGEDE
jgi:hypothetical protein